MTLEARLTLALNFFLVGTDVRKPFWCHLFLPSLFSFSFPTLPTVLVKDLTQRTVQQVQAGAMAVGNVLNAVTTNYKGLRPSSLAEGLNQVIEVCDSRWIGY